MAKIKKVTIFFKKYIQLMTKKRGALKNEIEK